MGGTSLNVLASAIQQALSRAYPNPLPSNQVLTRTADGLAGVGSGATATATLTPNATSVWGGPMLTGTIPGVVVEVEGGTWNNGEWQ